MENFPNKERNIEQDRHEFIKAIDSVVIEEIPAVFNNDASGSLRNSLDKTKLFILGETHGVKENVDIIYTLFKKFGFRQLALEWNPDLQTIARQYLETGEIDFEAIQDSPDGRITAGHFALLKKLQNEGLLDKLVFFDGPQATTWNERDANMAQNIVKNLSNYPTLVVAGNLHTKMKPLTFNDTTGVHYPMGLLVKDQIPDVPSGKIKYITGKYHNYGTRNFFEDPEQEKVEPKFCITEDGLYTFVLPEAHTAIVPNPSERL